MGSSDSHPEMGWGAGVGAARGSEDASTRWEPEMLLYLHHKSNKLSDEVQNAGLRGGGGWSRPSEEDTVVGENPPTQNETRMRKPRTKSPTPLGKRKNRWKVQTIRENRLHYRRNRRPPPHGPPAERAQAPRGTRRRDASVRSSWVNRVSPLIYYIYVS